MIKIGKTYRWHLGPDFTRLGRVLGFDGDDIVIVKWEGFSGQHFVRRDQLC